MNVKKWNLLSFAFFSVGLVITSAATPDVAAFAGPCMVTDKSSGTAFITAEELKAKLARNEPVTIIDVRSASSLIDGGDKIQGAIYVKLRRLKYRLGLAPLKDVSRNREVVTYCACPNDESSVKAAQVLVESGFKHVRVLKGGWVLWKKANGQVEPRARPA